MTAVLLFATIVPLTIAPTSVLAQVLSTGAASPLTGEEICRSGHGDPQCRAYGFDPSEDLAFPGNGLAQAAVALNDVAFGLIHQVSNLNDGYYGNGTSWIATTADSWLKIDLGQAAAIDRITFGRDRTGGYDDRDPGQFTIAVAETDDVYANGDASNDDTEYTLVADSAALGFSGTIDSSETIAVSFPEPVKGRFVKMTFANKGTDVDEVEVFGAKPACDDDYILNPNTNHCYGLTEVLTWPDAEAAAVEAGGHLVTLNDETEQAWVLDTFGDQVAGGDIPSFWIGFNILKHLDKLAIAPQPLCYRPDYCIPPKGISKRVTDTQVLASGYTWASGEPVTYTHWNRLWSEPNNNPKSWAPIYEKYADLCAEVGFLCPEVGVWNDRPNNWPTLKGIIELPAN